MVKEVVLVVCNSSTILLWSAMVDETLLEEKLAEELLAGLEVIPTGSGFLVTTAWRWPSDEMIEIYVRRVADRDDLYVVTDGGELVNYLFAGGIDLRQDDRDMEMLRRIAARSDAGISDYQIVKGANNESLPRSIRLVLEAVKEGAFIFWHKLG
jgi:hypothetical protein